MLVTLNDRINVNITSAIRRHQPNGYQFITAANGAQGLELALSEKPDLIIMDLRMPRRTGLEVLAALRERDVHIPVILMTFHGSEETAVRAFRLGARDYVIKPYEPEEMLAAIDRALAEGRLRVERDQLTEGLMGANEQLERRVKELDVLSRVGKSVTAVLDTEQLLNRIVDAGLYLTGAEEGSLLLIDEETGDLYMRAQRNVGERFARGFRVKVRDVDCSFKLFKRELVCQLFPKLQVFREEAPSGWKVTAYDVELLYLFDRAGHGIKEVEVAWENRDESDTKGHSSELARYARESISMAKQVLRVNVNRIRGLYDDIGPSSQ